MGLFRLETYALPENARRNMKNPAGMADLDFLPDRLRVTNLDGVRMNVEGVPEESKHLW